MPGILCEHCVAACCRYIALPIDEPESAREFDDIRWYLMHGGVSVFVEDGEWYICIQTACQHLQADHRCGVYETRPQICRDYTTDNCDYHSGDYGWSQHFTAPEHLDEYRRTHAGPRKKARRGAKGKSPRKPAARRGGVRAHPDPFRHRRAKSPLDRFAAQVADSRGVPLPVLRIGP